MCLVIERESIVSKNSLFRRAVRGVWENGHAEYEAWPAARRASVRDAVRELLAWLTDARSEDDLVSLYFEVGDPAQEVLLHHLPGPFGEDDALVLQGECFWRRSAALYLAAADASG